MPTISPLLCFISSSIACSLKREKEKQRQREQAMGAELVERDDSFKKPGSIPFKWEVRPGVPKHLPNQPDQHILCESDSRSYSLPATPSYRRLTPPPQPCFTPPVDLRISSFHSKLPSARYKVDSGPLLTRPNSVSTGCFLGHWFRWKWGKKKTKKEAEPEPDYTSELETIAWWSMSTRKASRSPLWDSLSSSSFSSHRSSPRPIADSEWAGFGLF